MRSSRRTLGLQPELIPEDSDSNDGSDQQDSVAVDIQADDPQSVALENITPAVSSDDVNIDDSNFSKVTSESDSEEEVITNDSQLLKT